MRDIAIREIVEELKTRGVNLSSTKSLDFFAREGDWQTSYYANFVSEVHAWEIDPSYESALRKNLPKNAKITIGDSHVLAKNCNEKFEMIVLDNPQGCYGEVYCEHFDALEVALPLLSDNGLIMFNVKTKPFNYSDKIQWQKRRNEFYGVEASNLDIGFVKSFYVKLFEDKGFSVEFDFLCRRPHEDDLWVHVSKLSRKKP